MSDSGFLAVFLLGLLGGTHCVGMCGGIVSALSASPTTPSSFPLHLAYSLGRISSYGIAGAIMGAIGSLGLLLNNLLPVQIGLYVAANLMLVALGLYLTGFTRSLAFTERMGQRIWKHIQPYARRFLPARTPLQAFPLGMIWGWLPCGLVYSVLSVALLSGSALRGGATLLAFGLGTLPNLLLAGMLLVRFRRWVQARAVRLCSGLLVMGFGIFGLANASTLGGRLWQGIVCHL
ncbi:MAG: sulfite exporter TauE/SafE family protein [Proteobacteria bacterium]|nr:sulfite exporter TauE/SafE family protein [Pseudomonadota bacterium]HQR03382.1 sulfite exporter TauE/SafE family protein [Rhodocyclaceae bacterium]